MRKRIACDHVWVANHAAPNDYSYRCAKCDFCPFSEVSLDNESESVVGALVMVLIAVFFFVLPFIAPPSTAGQFHDMFRTILSCTMGVVLLFVALLVFVGQGQGHH